MSSDKAYLVFPTITNYKGAVKIPSFAKFVPKELIFKHLSDAQRATTLSSPGSLPWVPEPQKMVKVPSVLVHRLLLPKKTASSFQLRKTAVKVLQMERYSFL